MNRLYTASDLGRKVRNRSNLANKQFPSDIDRNHFGSWLSGFVDGEGSFQLRSSWGRDSFRANVRFQINLRADDVEVLSLIQAYWGCGYVTYKKRGRVGQDSCMFHVERKHDLNGIVIPHFTKYPLIAKKKNDFAIWSQGVGLCVEVMNRLRQHRGGFGRGSLPSWSDDDILEFEMLVAQMTDEREYRVPTSLSTVAAYNG